MTSGLANKVAIVTGASSGIGRSIALALAREGASLVLPGRRMDVLRAVAQECIQFGAKAQSYKLDLLQDTEFAAFKAQVDRDFSGADILVHSAGMFASASVADASLRDFDLLYQCNVRAPFALTQLFLTDLAKRRGQIVFINSTAGFMAVGGVSQYAATKHALKGFAD